MDSRPLFQALHALAEDNAAFFRQSASETGRRFVAAFTAIREHARCLEPVLRHFASVCHLFDLDAATPANGYRSLAQTARCCLAHVLHKSRYVAANRRSVFFRTGHNVAELEAYCAALAQLRALLYLAQRLLTHNRPGCLFHHAERGLTEQVLREYCTLHKGCFYGRCLGFQFAPSIRPFLQTIAISLVSFGENYRRHDSGLSMAAGSLFTSGKFAIDPELRGAEFERITQNLDVHFWKSFWNLTETELLASVASLASTPVQVSRALTVPPEAFELPLAADPSLTITITPPVAHTGPGPVHVRLISHELREGQRGAEGAGPGRSLAGAGAGAVGQGRAGAPLAPAAGSLPRRRLRGADVPVARAVPAGLGAGAGRPPTLRRLRPGARGPLPARPGGVFLCILLGTAPLPPAGLHGAAGLPGGGQRRREPLPHRVHAGGRLRHPAPRRRPGRVSRHPGAHGGLALPLAHPAGPPAAPQRPLQMPQRLRGHGASGGRARGAGEAEPREHGAAGHGAAFPRAAAQRLGLAGGAAGRRGTQQRGRRRGRAEERLGGGAGQQLDRRIQELPQEPDLPGPVVWGVSSPEPRARPQPLGQPPGQLLPERGRGAGVSRRL